MKKIAFLNVKGGVGKTTSSIAFAYILAHYHGKRVLILDLDKQANTTRVFGAYDMELPSVSELLTEPDMDIREAIVASSYDGIDVCRADMRLVKANLDVLLDTERPQQTRLRDHLQTIEEDYDYCVMDCPPDINMATINALAVVDDVLIPIKIDNYAFEGLQYVIEVIEEMQSFNPKLSLAGCFVTMFSRNNVNRCGIEDLNRNLEGKVFKTYIRQTVKVQESTYVKPLLVYDKKCTASQDYLNLVSEYLEK